MRLMPAIETEVNIAMDVAMLTEGVMVFIDTEDFRVADGWRLKGRRNGSELKFHVLTRLGK